MSAYEHRFPVVPVGLHEIHLDRYYIRSTQARRSLAPIRERAKGRRQDCPRPKAATGRLPSKMARPWRPPSPRVEREVVDAGQRAAVARDPCTIPSSNRSSPIGGTPLRPVRRLDTGINSAIMKRRDIQAVLDNFRRTRSGRSFGRSRNWRAYSERPLHLPNHVVG